MEVGPKFRVHLLSENIVKYLILKSPVWLQKLLRGTMLPTRVSCCLLSFIFFLHLLLSCIALSGRLLNRKGIPLVLEVKQTLYLAKHSCNFYCSNTMLKKAFVVVFYTGMRGKTIKRDKIGRWDKTGRWPFIFTIKGLGIALYRPLNCLALVMAYSIDCKYRKQK